MGLKLFRMNNHREYYSICQIHKGEVSWRGFYRIEGFFSPNDFWIGLRVDHQEKIARLCFLPMLGFDIRF